jgi:hypothetical protein
VKGFSILASRAGMSFQQIASGTLWDVIYMCMEKMNVGRKAEERIEPSSVIEKPTRKFVSTSVHKEAQVELDHLQKSKYKSQYVVLAFDGGSIKGREYYLGICYVPHKKDIPPLLVCFKNSIKDQKKMAETIAETIKSVWAFANVVNIVVDGLRHQIQASTLFPSSQGGNFQDFLESDGHALPFLLPDIPHLFQLMLTHARANSNLELGNILDEIDRIGAEIRKPKGVKAIGSKCPTYPPTRFFYCVFKMKFMLEKKESILNYFQRLVFFFFLMNFIPKLLKVLIPMYICLTCYESDNQDASMVYLYHLHLFFTVIITIITYY